MPNGEPHDCNHPDSLEESGPVVSIIIPAYNHEEYAEQSVLSAINQSYNNIEIIIIDDGSTDNTARVIEKVVSSYSARRSITFMRQENCGVTKTLNTALELAKGEFVQFLASDDAYLPDKTRISLKALLSHSDRVAAVYSDGYIINDNNDRIIRFSDKYIRPLSRDTYKELLLRNWIPAMGVLYRRSAIECVGRFDERLRVEDHDLLLRISKTHAIVSIPDSLFLYRWHTSNISQNQSVMNKQLALLIAKHQDMDLYWRFKTALRELSPRSCARLFSPLNLDLLIRSLIKRTQVILTQPKRDAAEYFAGRSRA